MDGDPRKSSVSLEPAESRTGNRDPNHETSFRQPNYEFWGDRDERMEGGNYGFDYKQRWPAGEQSWKMMNDHLMNKSTNSNEIALEMGADIDDLRHDPSAISRDSRRVSFETGVASFQNQSQGHDGNGIINRNEDASRRVSNVSAPYGKSGLLSRLRSTKSRLIDRSPEEVQLMSGLLGGSGQMKSGMLGKASENEEDDDPFADEDLPDEYKKTTLNAFTWLQYLSLVVIIGALLCSLVIPSLKDLDVWQLKLWKWLVFLLVLICGRLVSGWGIRIIVFFIEMNFFLRKRMLYFVYGVKRPVQNCLWLALVLLAWHFLFDKKVEKQSLFLQYVTKILICFLVSTFLWLLKTLLVKVLASSFHVSTYFDRIQETLFTQYVIVTLSGSPIIEGQRMEEEDERTAAEIRRLQTAGATVPSDLREDAFLQQQSSGMLKKTFTRLKTLPKSGSTKKADSGIALEHVHKLNQENISAWNMKRLMKMVRHGTLMTLDEQIMEDDSMRQIRSEQEATAAAKKIFHNVACRGSKFIYLEDLMRFMREDEALRTMATFEGAYEQSRISKKSLKNWVLNAYRERKALALTLNDTKTAVNKLHNIINVVAGTIIIVIWLIILEIASSRIITLFSSQLVLAAFIFGNTCKTIFESIIFLFIIHPFDVGDRCEINGVQVVVEEMNILTTVFLRYDNMKMVFPNSVLSTTPIGNFYRSPDMLDLIDFTIHIVTPVEKIAIVKQRITNYVINRKDHWCSDPMIVVKDLDELNRMKFSLWVTHKMNYQDIGERLERRSRLAEEIACIFREHDIQYRLFPIDINYDDGENEYDDEYLDVSHDDIDDGDGDNGEDISKT
ncbi:mechanosensitive ion channel protein 8-like [Hibiscus syriacus]|uniref:mechanosensitive ion channel protein 8-like n=1 Tax=Hibiscus syriacus TaxID=106335 RepID=UPI001924BAB3|nr:mechanosensitive ion channel protein 8-like [Hibiscus syriacus]